MYKRLCLFAMLLLGAATVSAQQEIYFNDTNVNTKDIQIEKSIQGVSIGTEGVDMLTREYNKLSFPVYVHYFREDRIAPTLSMHTFAGLKNGFDHTRVFYIDGEANVGPAHTYYNLSAHVGTELRWHVGLRTRYLKNKLTCHNDGWFLAVPIELQTPLLHQPDGFWAQQWRPDMFTLQANVGIKAGYTHSFNAHWLMEVSAQYTPFGFYFDRYGADFSFHDRLRDMFRLELKAVYVFK